MSHLSISQKQRDQICVMLESLKPEFGAVGSRDIEVRMRRDDVDLIISTLAALTQPASPALKLPWSEKACRECGSKSLSWGFAIINKSAVQNGLLRISDVDGLFYLGCDECSETVTRVSPDEVVELLTALQQFTNAPHTAPIEPICATGGEEWTDKQCLEFLTIAFRHANISGDILMDDIRLGVRMATRLVRN